MGIRRLLLLVLVAPAVLVAIIVGVVVSATHPGQGPAGAGGTVAASPTAWPSRPAEVGSPSAVPAPSAPALPAAPTAPPPPVGPAPQGDPSTWASAALSQELGALPVYVTAGGGDYRRASFGGGWTSGYGDGCNTRNEVLKRDLLAVVMMPGRACTVQSGVLDDPYSGRQIAFQFGPQTSDDVQIDHVVPLAVAWRSGAWLWTDDQREAFANDMRDLLAVDGPTNDRKSDKTPSAWMPPDQAEWCGYGRIYSSALLRYGLAVSSPDRQALQQALTTCAS